MRQEIPEDLHGSEPSPRTTQLDVGLEKPIGCELPGSLGELGIDLLEVDAELDPCTGDEDIVARSASGGITTAGRGFRYEGAVTGTLRGGGDCPRLRSR